MGTAILRTLAKVSRLKYAAQRRRNSDVRYNDLDFLDVFRSLICALSPSYVLTVNDLDVRDKIFKGFIEKALIRITEWSTPYW